MVVKILVCWDNPEEIEKAHEIRTLIDKALDAASLHAGERSANMPSRTFGITVPEPYIQEEKVNGG
ncbi:unnamed protein product [marine sediment metagenome]|uniref:Uncharacterized protein n=1 Tax=marine sediment metagenome TaxID=412755 RepID=X1N847_9ZZZZ